ncbi:5111_t:CDS:1, partial [Scutellospora calospora]
MSIISEQTIKVNEEGFLISIKTYNEFEHRVFIKRNNVERINIPKDLRILHNQKKIDPETFEDERRGFKILKKDFEDKKYMIKFKNSSLSLGS